MASPLEQPSIRRKLIYFGAILVLFTLTLIWRGSLHAGSRPAWWTVEEQANRLGLREENQGEVDLTASAIGLTLTGSRGLAICGLWWAATEAQKRHEWNELELLVISITKLQPHFITPWLFQSWNLSYNVAVESDRIKDKYFWFTRGCELLGEGIAQNQKNPDLRFTLGYFYQNKIGHADEANTLMCLFQMSCMDPAERDPRRLRKPGSSEIDLGEFEKFCRKHPHLVRRLRERLRLNTATDVVGFLADHQKIPTRYQPKEGQQGIFELNRNPLKQFPILPPPFKSEPQEKSGADAVEDEFDNFMASRGWFAYSHEFLPPPNSKPGPGSISLSMEERKKYRLPRAMALVIFRGYPARAQSYVAERLQREGWYDEGWAVDDYRQRESHWFPDRRVVVGDGRSWSSESWGLGFTMWSEHGRRTGLHKEPEELQNLRRRAERIEKLYQTGPDQQVQEIRPEHRGDPDLVASLDAHQELYWYLSNRRLTNFPRFYHEADVERRDETIRARRVLLHAEHLRRTDEIPEVVVKAYEDAIALWKPLMLKYPEWREGMDVQDRVYRTQLRYLEQVQILWGRPLKPVLLVPDCLPPAMVRPGGFPLWLPTANLIPARSLPLPLPGPFDIKDANGTPLIKADTPARVRQHRTSPDERPVRSEFFPPPGSPG